MKLSEKTLYKFFKGALRYTCEGGYITPARFSLAQTEFMADPSYDRGWRNYAKFTGGIRMELVTDSPFISFDYKASCMHERANTVDLYVNGALTSVYKIGDRLKGSIRFDLPEGENRVTIYLPGESIFSIKNFQIDGGYRSVRDKGQRLLVIGDSITQGAGPDIASAAYIHSLQRRTGYNILGQGMGGYRYEPRDLMKTDGFEPDKILVFLGTNYYDTPIEQYDYKDAVEKFYERLTELYPNTPILCVTPLWRNNNVDMPRLLWCIEAIKNTCRKYPSVTVADGFTLMPNVDECLADGVHPNTYGSTLLAENLAKVMKDIKF